MRRLFGVGRGYPPRLVGYVLAVSIVGTGLAIGAGIGLTRYHVSILELIGVAVFLGLTLLAELRPVPVDLNGTHLISVAFVFVVASQILYSWEWSVLIGAAAMAASQLSDRVPLFKLSFNTSVYAVAAGTAALPEILSHARLSHTGNTELICLVFASGAIFVVTNVILVSFAVAAASGGTVRAILHEYLHTALAFSIMIFLAAQIVIFWRLSPPLVILVGAPLFTLNLYQRSSIRGRVAAKEAATDSLTGLKNHRAYQEEVDAALAAAAETKSSQTLCMIDVDRFKQVNDRYGHPAGDAVLRLLGTLIEELAPGAAYRLGGDEFALLLPGEAQYAKAVITELQNRLRLADDIDAVVERPTISSGIATYPMHTTEPAELKKRADLALYQSKRNGKDRISIYTGAELDTDIFGDDSIVHAAQDVRLQTAERLVAVVDARDAYVGRHSAGVGHLVESIGAVLGLDPEELRKLRLAGLLHDLGKIGVPDDVLNSPGPLTADQQVLMRKHPEIGFELLDGLDLDPVDTWVLHHHEHWDGSGYPLGLAGEKIPFGSRIILVADAFEAMTTHRTYQRAISVEAAMAELRENAGKQFDPDVVAALGIHLSMTFADEDTSPAELPTWST